MRKTPAWMLAALTLLAGAPALAFGPSFGLRLGVGPGFGSGDKAIEEASINSFAVGPAVKVDLVMLELEVDLLYTQVTSEFGNIEAVSTDLDIPIIARISVLPTPILSLKVGAGLAPRFHLGSEIDGKEVKDADDQTEDMVLYLPVSIAGQLGLGVVSVGLEIRYMHQLTEAVKDDDNRVHHLMFMGGAFF